MVTSHTCSDLSNVETSAGQFELLIDEELDLTLQSLPGIGPRYVEQLRGRGVSTCLDLLTLFPLRYERIHYHPTERGWSEQPDHVLFHGVIVSVRKPRRGTRQPLEVVVACGDTRVVLVWFHPPGGRFVDGLTRDRWLEVDGDVDWSRGLPRIMHPRTRAVAGPSDSEPSVAWRPVYPAVDGVPPRRLRGAIEAAFDRLAPHLIDVVPAELRAELDLGSVREAIGALHVLAEPAGGWEAGWARARDRLVYEEFYTLQRMFALQQQALRARAAAPVCASRELGRAVVRSLPFKLTGDQAAALATIATELGRRVPMRRLLQGDVGSGKTVVALTAAAIAVDSGFHAALLAPTDVLARQHFTSATKLLAAHGVAVHFVAGAVAAPERAAARTALDTGRPSLFIGTHALLSEEMRWRDLGLVIIDEQHKFGVEQREQLLANVPEPHLLAMTATPIPRSLAHAVFGELDLLTIRERPPGREPVRTYLRDFTSRPAIYEWVASTVLPAGHQAFVVFPAIEQDARGFRALLDGAEQIANSWLRGHRVAVLHGKMSQADKQDVMARFAGGEFDVLCATTVIEVGVDVPRATVMVIESAEAFGLSQLHQLRGRVGRGTEVSRCVLVHGANPSDTARSRLDAFTRLSDGFELAEIDLMLRGPGELLGARQAGAAEFRFGDLVADAELLTRARADVRRQLYGDVAVPS